MKILVEKATPQKVQELGATAWPIWSKEISTFPWEYDQKETCYILEGEVEVTPEHGAPTRFGAGDLVVFPAGMKCVWKISRAVRKHYRFEAE
jgi:uncharacterized cupin superfamily protein